jgi:hypothetical protein
MKTRLIPVILLLSVACTTIHEPTLYTRNRDNNCYKQYYYDYHEDEIPPPIHSVELAPVVAENFSFSSINIAHAMGMLELLNVYLASLEAFERNPSLENRLRHLERFQQLSQQIEFAELEISSVVSEINCEEERIYQVANYLRGKENEKTSRLTIASIVVGGMGAIMAVALVGQGKAPELVGLGTGITEASLGLLMLFNEKEIEFSHERNHLREIWEAPTVSKVFPAPVWYYLNYVADNPDAEPAKREQIIKNWRSLAFFDEVKEKHREELKARFFGDGGRYNSDELTDRANMYEQLNSEINLMLQDLKDLSFEIEKIQSKKLKGWVDSNKSTS